MGGTTGDDWMGGGMTGGTTGDDWMGGGMMNHDENTKTSNLRIEGARSLSYLDRSYPNRGIIRHLAAPIQIG